MSEMIERGIKAAERAVGDGFVATYGREAAEAIVRAVITVMRKPTEAMIEAGDACDDSGFCDEPGYGASAEEHYEAMVNAALK